MYIYIQYLHGTRPVVITSQFQRGCMLYNIELGIRFINCVFFLIICQKLDSFENVETYVSLFTMCLLSDKPCCFTNAVLVFLIIGTSSHKLYYK